MSWGLACTLPSTALRPCTHHFPSSSWESTCNCTRLQSRRLLSVTVHSQAPPHRVCFCAGSRSGPAPGVVLHQPQGCGGVLHCLVTVLSCRKISHVYTDRPRGLCQIRLLLSSVAFSPLSSTKLRAETRGYEGATNKSLHSTQRPSAWHCLRD